MNKKMLYVGTPKCGSSSIKDALQSKYDTVTVRPHTMNGWAYTDAKHQPAQPLIDSSECVVLDFHRPPIWVEDFEYSPRQNDWNDPIFNDDFYKWTVVRNPWHRVAAAWTWLTSQHKGCNNDSIGVTFPNFVKAVTSSSLPLVCLHPRPERYILKYLDGDMWARLSSVTECRSPLIADRTVGGLGAALRMWGFWESMKSCDKETNAHTQRWEDSTLFISQVVVTTPNLDELNKGLEMLKQEGIMDQYFGGTLRSSWEERGMMLQALLDHPGWAHMHQATSMENGRHELDRVVRFENLQSGIEEVCSDLGVETWDLPHNNNQHVSDKNRFYESMYEGNIDLIDAVRNWYKYEINEFGYEFGTFL